MQALSLQLVRLIDGADPSASPNQRGWQESFGDLGPKGCQSFSVEAPYVLHALPTLTVFDSLS